MSNDSTKDDANVIDMTTRQPAAARDKVAERERLERGMFEKTDGRTLRRVGETVHVSVRVAPAAKDRLHRLAAGTGKSYREVVEEALEYYEQMLKGISK